ncbi:MAG: hypothetical protein H6618_06080 [Deltaproteobacteria bacterium]|nr:hypothetical protein [Deltaproteobacteria bacterium]
MTRAFILCVFFSSTNLFSSVAIAGISCQNYFTQGSQLRYQRGQEGSQPIKKLYTDESYSCDEGICFYGFLENLSDNRYNIVEGHYSGSEFYFAQLIPEENGRGWKSVIHHQGSCNQKDATGQLFNQNGRLLSYFTLLSMNQD